VLADLWGCPPERLSDEGVIRQAMVEAALRAGATVVDATFHRFEGGGVTGVVAVRESHLTIHTWPERGYAAIDVFLCGRCDPHLALDHLSDRLGAVHRTVHEHERGRAAPAAGGRSRMLPLYALTMVVALCSIVYELLLAQTLSALLGNTVLRYSVTIGCFLGALGLGALLCGTRLAGAARRLTRVELALSALGGLSVPLFHFLDMGQWYLFMSVPAGSPWEPVGPLLFLVATHAVIVAIGLLSGFEVPLLLALGEQARAQSTNRVLGVDYFGALLGSVLFPIVFLRSFGLLATAFAVALLNAVAALLLVAWQLRGERLRFALLGTGIAAAMVLGLAHVDRIEQYFLKKLYYDEDADSLSSLLAPQPERPAIARHRSAYQTIDLVRQASDAQWVWDAVSRRPVDAVRHPRDVWLYLDREYQVFSGTEEIYHEWFVHAPVQAVGRVPERVLVLGGGDALALREILKYGLVRRVVHVELDAEMIRLADEHPMLSRLNGRPHADPRVSVVQADAFRWLRRSSGRFDAIYVDMPYARDHNLSVVYSREFYALVRRHLAPGGFVSIDTPGGWCHGPGTLWAVYDNTLRAAGLRTVVPLVSRVNLDTPRFEGVLDAIVARARVVTTADDGSTTELSADATRAFLLAAAREEVEDSVQEFVVAFPEARTIATAWRDFDVPLYAFGPEQLPLAFDQTCPRVHDPASVNSVFRPTLPPLELLAMGLP
jgi:spermidine synthase